MQVFLIFAFFATFVFSAILPESNELSQFVGRWYLQAYTDSADPYSCDGTLTLDIWQSGPTSLNNIVSCVSRTGFRNQSYSNFQKDDSIMRKPGDPYSFTTSNFGNKITIPHSVKLVYSRIINAMVLVHNRITYTRPGWVLSRSEMLTAAEFNKIFFDGAFTVLFDSFPIFSCKPSCSDCCSGRFT